MDWRTLTSIVLSPLLALGVLCACVFILLMPDAWATSLRIYSLRENYGGFMGAASVVCGVFVLMHGGKWIAAFALRRVEAARDRRDLPLRARSLSEGERRIVLFCVTMKQQSIHMPLVHAAANSLKQKGFLMPSAGAGDGRLWAFTFSDEAWDVLLEEFKVDEEVRAQIMGTEWFERIHLGQTNWKAWEDMYWKYGML